MIKKLPRHLPTLADMMFDLSATPQEIAQAVGVSQSTVYRWLNVGNAPRGDMLALYWVTSWGLSELDAELFNKANIQQALADSLKQEVQRLETALRSMGRIGEYGSANDPHRGVSLTRVNPEQPWARPQAAHHATDKHRRTTACLDCGSFSTG